MVDGIVDGIVDGMDAANGLVGGRRDRSDRDRSVIDPDLLDPVLPCWHWRSKHTAFLLGATPPAAFAAARTVTLADLGLSTRSRRMNPDMTLVDRLAQRGFFPLQEDEKATGAVLVLGRIGHLWQPASRRSNPAEFDSFREPGYARAALLLAGQAIGDDTLMVAEARVLATDESALEGLSLQWMMTAWTRRLPLAELLLATRRRLHTVRHSERTRVG